MSTTPNQPMDDPANRPEETKPNFDAIATPVLSILHQVWLAGLGAATLAGKETAKLVDTLVEKGKEVEPGVIDRGKQMGAELSGAAQEVGSRVKDVASRVGKRAEAAEAMLDERVRAGLERMGYATREDFQALSKKLDELTNKIEEMAAKRNPRRPAGEEPM
ncbi:MAG TPA: phasin family protein [Bryobacteraceae bacterium]|nr:phasin family protein [Bryobacteraceae bacterium]